MAWASVEQKVNYNREWYQRNKERVNALNAKRLTISIELLRRLKDRPCQDCSMKFPPEAMDFDHVRGRKRNGVGRMKRASLSSLMIEAAKCDLVCANCHRVRTKFRLQARKRLNLAF